MMSNLLNNTTNISRSIVIKPHEKGQSLISFLTTRFTYFNESEWITAITQERILLNGCMAQANTMLHQDDEILFTPEPYIEPDVSTDYFIIAEDDDFLFIHKPPNLPCHPAGRYVQNTLLSLLQKTYQQLFLVNRLDRETSGIVILAKHHQAARHGGMCLMNKSVEKTYLVLVEGSFPSSIDAQGFLIPDASSPIRKKKKFVFDSEWDFFLNQHKDDDEREQILKAAQRAHTSFTKIGEYDSGSGIISKLKAEIYTGKTHQIRATAYSLGFPVVGDKLYGIDTTIFLRFIHNQLSDLDKKSLRMPHQALHCSHIQFAMLNNSTKYNISSKTPESWLI